MFQLVFAIRRSDGSLTPWQASSQQCYPTVDEASSALSLDLS